MRRLLLLLWIASTTMVAYTQNSVEYWDKETKKKQWEGVWKDSLHDGQWTFWYENGQMKAKGSYILDEKDGQWTTWYDNGKTESKIAYRNNEIEGKYSYYYNFECRA